MAVFVSTSVWYPAVRGQTTVKENNVFSDKAAQLLLPLLSSRNFFSKRDEYICFPFYIFLKIYLFAIVFVTDS
jgi:hypothetical protein